MIRDANFDPDRRPVFRYALFGHQTNFRKPVGHLRAVVTNHGGGPALDAHLSMTAPEPSGTPVALGVVAAGGEVVHDLVLESPILCATKVSAVVQATDFVGAPVVAHASLTVGPVCPGPGGSVTGPTDPAPSPGSGGLGVTAPPASPPPAERGSAIVGRS